MAQYDFDYEINRSDSSCVKWSRYGEEYLPMFIADMDFPSPPSIIKRIRERAEHPIFGYTFPREELFAAFQRWYQKTYRDQLEKEAIGLLSGIVPALSLAGQVRAGKVLVNTPSYLPFLQGPLKAGKEVIQSPLKRRNNHYEIDFEDLERKVKEGVSVFYLCNPHNPVGRVYTRSELQEISRFAKAHELIVVSDEVHCELVYDQEHVPFMTVDDYAREHSITFMGPGKTCNIPGLGIAFSVIPNKELKAQFQAVTYMLSYPNIFGIEAAIGAYQGAEEWKAELIKYLSGNRDYLEQELKRRFPKVIFPHTEGTYLQWLDFRPYGIEHPAKWLREKGQIILNDGREFGAAGFVRMNFGCPRQQLATALDRIEVLLKNNL